MSLLSPVSFTFVGRHGWRVEVRKNEVWLIRNGQPAQLTRDGKTISLSGAFTLIRLSDIPPESLYTARLSWIGAGKIRLTAYSTKDFLVP